MTEEKTTYGYGLDPELTRAIFKALFDGTGVPETDHPEIVLRHHFRVLYHAGYIETNQTGGILDHQIINSHYLKLESMFGSLSSGSDSGWFYLSFEGDGFVKNILDDTIWTEVKNILSKVGSAALQMVVATAAQVVAAKIENGIR